MSTQSLEIHRCAPSRCSGHITSFMTDSWLPLLSCFRQHATHIQQHYLSHLYTSICISLYLLTADLLVTLSLYVTQCTISCVVGNNMANSFYNSMEIASPIHLLLHTRTARPPNTGNTGRAAIWLNQEHHHIMRIRYATTGTPNWHNFADSDVSTLNGNDARLSFLSRPWPLCTAGWYYWHFSFCSQWTP
jgi:hypothetical protein